MVDVALFDIETILNGIRRTFPSTGDDAQIARSNSIYSRAALLGRTAALSNHLNAQSRETFSRLFRFVELSKGNAIRREVGHAKAARFAGIPEELLARERLYKAQFAGAKRRMEELLAVGISDSPEFALHRRRRFAYGDSLETLLRLYEQQYPRYYALLHEAPISSIDRLQSMIGPGAAVVEYFTAGDRFAALVVTEDDYSVHEAGSVDEVSRLTTDLRAAIKTDHREAFVTASQALYRAAFEAVDRSTSQRRLMVIPDGVLLSVPFEALSRGETDSAGWPTPSSYVLFDRTVSYAYSATLLVSTLSEAPVPYEGTGRLLVVAPVFRAGVDIPAHVVGLETEADTVFFGPLLGTAREAVALERLFRRRAGSRAFARNPVDVMLGGQATEVALKQADLPSYRFVHIAAHAYTNTLRPELSGIVFDDPTDTGNGILHTGEVYGMSLNAELVYLSACETGLTGIRNGEGIIGLSRAFLFAGARNLVVSLWEGHDRHSMATAAVFYDNMLDGVDRAEALRIAKLKLVQQGGSPALPRSWAPFILVGD